MNIKSSRTDFFNITALFIISCLFVLDLFANKGQPATFDGPTHLANIAMFFKSMKGGELHVTWTDGFANYGMPIGLIAQQTTSYLGAAVNFITNNIVMSYNTVVFIGAFLSVLFFYLFLRLYVKPVSAFVGAAFFHLAPYRIINVYIRGALPEFFASIFLPLLLIGIYFLFHNKELKGFLLITISTAFMILTHPMMIIIYAFVYFPYLLFCGNGKNHYLRSIFLFVIAYGIGIGLTGYYSIPLLSEVKYFYYGLDRNHFVPGQFMSMANFFDPRWFYFYKGDIFTRGHFIQSGLPEILTVIGGLGVTLYALFKRKKDAFNISALSVFISLGLIFFMTWFATPFFQKINVLSSIQHQWRLFSAFIFLPPIILAYMVNRFDSKILAIGLIALICIFRFPELYGKNYVVYPESHYFFYKENLHGNIMNTIWTGPTQTYPMEDKKSAIIEGKGTITPEYIGNSLRKYRISGETNTRIVDYTFYFPGWRAYVDGKETTIQFQDPAYRGVITYDVPKGDHTVLVKFTNTKSRWLGLGLSTLSLFFFAGGIMVMKNAKSRRNS